jgi:uncharacterized membrane protein YhaH (DUF805 family)
VIDLVLPDAPASRAANLVVWSVVAATLVGWQVAALLTPSLPSLADVVRRLRDRWPTRWALLIGWAWLGWHTFVQGSWG